MRSPRCTRVLFVGFSWFILDSLLSLSGTPAGAEQGGRDPAPAGIPLRGDGKSSATRRGPDAPPRLLEPRVGDELDAATDVQHYLLDIEVVPQISWIGGSNTMTVRSAIDGLSAFRFRLDSVFDITQVRVGAALVEWTRIDNATVEVALDRTYQAGEQFDLYVAYDGNPHAGGWGSVTMGFRPPGVWFSYTLSQPWFAYTWWPAKDDLRDKTTADLWFTVRGDVMAASNGRLEGIDDLGLGRTRYRWRTTYPMADYLYCYGIDQYNEFGPTWVYDGQEMPLRFFIRPESDTPEHRNSWLATAQMLTTYSDLFGIYPFIEEKYGMLEWDMMMGMEHQTLTSIIGGDFGFYWESGIAHELAHQWWGDAITCATWHDVWLNEGFADYCEALWAQYKPGSSGDAALHAEMAGPLRPENVDGTVYCYDISDIDRIFDYDLTYRKAGWVLHMLRRVLGDQAFFDVLHAYRTAFEGGAATTAGFQAVVEDATGRDFDWYFQEWIYLGGAPSYEYAWRQDLVDGARYVELYVRQVQPPADPTFSMPVDILVNQPDGGTHVVWNDAEAEHLLLAVAQDPVSSVALDPVPWILRRGAATTTFVEGPPKIVTAFPAPADTLTGPEVAGLEVVFHKHVAIEANDLVLDRDGGGSVACTFAYDPIRHAATLTPEMPLGSGSYTLTVSDDVRDVAANLPLDGEMVRPDGENTLPSGDGLAGGATVLPFTIVNPEDAPADDSPALAAAAELRGPTPSPFGGRTEIDVVMRRQASARLSIHDPAGRLVRTLLDGYLPAGVEHSSWDGKDANGQAVPSGVYFIRMEAGGPPCVAKVMLVR